MSQPNGLLDIDQLRILLPDRIERLEQDFPYACALFESRQGLRIHRTSKERSVSPLPPSRGLVITAGTAEGLRESAVDRVTGTDLDWCVQGLLGGAGTARAGGRGRWQPDPALRADFLLRPELDPGEVSLSEKMDRCAQLEERLRGADSRVVSAGVSYAEQWTEKLFVSRTRVLYQRLLHLTFAGRAVVSDGTATRVARVGGAWSAGLERAQVEDQEIADAVEVATRLLDAPRLGPGTYDIIGGPMLGGVIAHEAFGHGVEADLFLKDRAEASRYLGQQVASEVVDMYDSPAYPGLSGSYFFDDEGALATETKIIDRGILRNVLTDRHAAIHVPADRTANGRRESWARKSYARMTNTYFGPGQTSLDEMIGGVDRGLYIRDSSDGMEDPKGWGIQVEGAWVREIRSGQLTDRYYQPVVLTGYVPEMLHSIRAVGDDLRFDGLGICQKGHKEQVRVAVGGPHILFRARAG